MPTYDYKCKSCGKTFEFFHAMTAKPQKKCPECGKNALEKQIGSGAGIIFKGSGFYQTDYRDKAYSSAQAAAKKESEKPAATPAADKPAAAPAGDKSAAGSASTKPAPASGSSSSPAPAGKSAPSRPQRARSDSAKK
jgi:putative FmdB family regulatory protein